MIKTLYYCDKCGSFIPDDFAQVFVEGLCQRERKLDVLDKVYEQVMDKHFCPDCAEKIVDFCLTPIKIEPKAPEPLKVDEIILKVAESQPEEEQEEAPEAPEEQKPAEEPETVSEPKKDAHSEPDKPAKKNKNVRIDIGKLWALYDAKWKPNDIAKELGCSAQTVRNNLNSGRPVNIPKPSTDRKELEFTRIEDWNSDGSLL